MFTYNEYISSIFQNNVLKLNILLICFEYIVAQILILFLWVFFFFFWEQGLIQLSSLQS